MITAPIAKPLYFDTAATTRPAPEVLTAMVEQLASPATFANPSSAAHAPGRAAAAVIATARAEIAAELGCETDEVIFTSGATESNNLALRGVALAHASAGRHLITSAIEHKAVLECCALLEREGYEVTYVAPNRNGWVEPEAVARALRPDTLLVSLMHANNETGVLQPIAEVAALTLEQGVLLHVDAAQTVGKLRIDLSETPIDLLAFSASNICQWLRVTMKQTVTVYNQSATQIGARHDNLAPEGIYRLIDRFFIRGGACADIGCGIGRDSYWLSQHGYPVIGIDAAEGMLLEARRRYPELHFVLDSLPMLTVIGNSDFTNVLCSAVIMHLESDQLALAIVHLLRITTVGGVILVSFRGTNNANNREDGKLYTPIQADELIVNFALSGGDFLHYDKEYEAGRRLEWHNLVFRKLPHPTV